MAKIETGVDRLVELVGQKKKISQEDASKELGVSVAVIQEWAEFLEEEGRRTENTREEEKVTVKQTDGKSTFTRTQVANDGSQSQLAAKEVLARLTGAGASTTREAPVQITSKGKVVGFWDKDPKGNVSVQIKAGGLSAAKEKRLREFLDKLFD
jgi:hypothetical protein